MISHLALAALLSILHVGTGVGARHDIHISYCRAELGERSLKGKVSYYLDDFYRAVSAWNGVDAKRLSPSDFQSAARLYLAQTFRATANGNQPLAMTIVSAGVEDANIWFQFDFRSPARIASVTVDHRALFKEFNDQMNLLLVTVSGEEENFVMNTSNPTAHISR